MKVVSVNLIGVVVIVSCFTYLGLSDAEGIGRRHRHVQPANKPKAENLHDEETMIHNLPTNPPAPAYPVLHELDPDVPTAWGIIEATSEKGWYGVIVHSVMCSAYHYNQKLNEDHIVAEGRKGLTPGLGVFLGHDHKTGRWHILFHASVVIQFNPEFYDRGILRRQIQVPAPTKENLPPPPSEDKGA